MSRNILYCEDDRSVRVAVAKRLRRIFPNHVIKTAIDIQDALKESEPLQQLELVVTDGNLWYEDSGWDLAKQLRERGYAGPIVYYGGAEIPEEERRYFNDFIGKLADPERVTETLKKYI
jgi:DNA-binding NtrC family response regulator